jgi:succinoglycan biosynthesis protein ExoA
VAVTISIVVPCYNEAAHITALLDAVREQTLRATEIIVADCHSSDATLEIVEAYPHRPMLPPIRVVSCELRSTPLALNRAIEAASGDVIIRMDGHSRPDRDYVERCMQVLNSDGAGVVGGIWRIAPGAPTRAAAAIALAAALPFGAGDALYRTGQHLASARDVDTVPFGCFRRSLWQTLGGFDEHFLGNQDYEFNYRARLAGYRVILAPDIRATYVARSTLWLLARQYFRYGWWKAETLKRHPRSLRWRQAVPAAFVGALVLLSMLAVVVPKAMLALAVLVLLYAAAAAGASIHAASRAHTPVLLPYLPAVFATIHVLWGLGLLTNVITAGQLPTRVARPRRSSSDSAATRPVQYGPR